MTNKELQFALDKALEIAKGKEEQIKLAEQVNGFEIDMLKSKVKKLESSNRILNDLVSVNDHTSARMTISAIIGIAAGFILALILL